MSRHHHVLHVDRFKPYDIILTPPIDWWRKKYQKAENFPGIQVTNRCIAIITFFMLADVNLTASFLRTGFRSAFWVIRNLL
jgi:hypothetical protein